MPAKNILNFPRICTVYYSFKPHVSEHKSKRGNVQSFSCTHRTESIGKGDLIASSGFRFAVRTVLLSDSERRKAVDANSVQYSVWFLLLFVSLRNRKFKLSHLLPTHLPVCCAARRIVIAAPLATSGLFVTCLLPEGRLHSNVLVKVFV